VKHIASIFSPKEVGHLFLRNVDTSPHDATTKKTAIDTFAAVKSHKLQPFMFVAEVTIGCISSLPRFMHKFQQY
jgi:hypothetical protein